MIAWRKLEKFWLRWIRVLLRLEDVFQRIGDDAANGRSRRLRAPAVVVARERKPLIYPSFTAVPEAETIIMLLPTVS